MLTISFLPLVDFKTIEVTSRSTPAETLPDVVALLLLIFFAGSLVLSLRRHRRRGTKGPRRTRQTRGSRTAPRMDGGSGEKTAILVDGSNVMHWLDGTPQLAPLVQVVRSLQSQGLKPGVVFDANAGHKLVGRYLNDSDFASMLSLPRSQVLVVPKRRQADPFLLDAAKEFGARIVTNDRFRDWAKAHPRVLEPDFLIRGGMRDGKVWLTGVPAETAPQGVQAGTRRGH